LQDLPNYLQQDFSRSVFRPQGAAGFEHVSRYPDGEMAEESSVWKYVKYESHVGATGFDPSGFIDAFRDATRTLVAMEKGIDKILERLA